MSLALTNRKAALLAPWNRNPLWSAARAVPSLDLRFAESKSLTDAASGQSLVTFTRASSGTYVGSDGVLQTATTNEPRFDHNPTTGESLGLLVEEQRTNLLLRSEEFNTTWTATNGSVSANSASSPDGLTTADTFTPLASTAFHGLVQTATVTASTAHTFSVFVKGDGAPFVQIACDNGASVGGFINVNTATGAITRGAEAAGGATNVSGSVNLYGNGWLRIAVTATHTGTTSRAIISPLPSGSSTTGINTSLATTATDRILVWGAQLEAGSFPTSYIPTTGATATRNADVASITGTNFSSWYSQSEGTVFASSSSYGASNTNRRIAFATDGTTSNRFGLLYNSSNAPQIVVASAGTVVANPNAALTGANYAIAAAYKLDDYAITAAGSSPSTDTAGALPVGINQLSIGSQINAEHINGTIRRFCYWGQRLPNSTLQAITQ